MNRPSEELLHKTLENRATAAEAASVAEWLATDSGQAWASRYIGRDFDRQESCGDYEREEVASERIFARIKTALTRGRRRRILFRVAAVVIPVALVLGVVVNYVGAPKGDPFVLFLGVALIVVAIICNGIASGRMRKSGDSAAQNRKGIILAVVAGVLMSFFYRFVAAAMDLDNFAAPTPGMLTPYSAIFVFSVGVLLSNFVFNTYAMRRPFVGAPVSYREYFRGSLPTHLVGMLGGAVWCLGTAFSYIAAGKAGAAISYALGQGAPMIAAVWGVFIWKEFKGADRKTNTLLAVMFLFFIAGLASIIASGGN